MKKILILLDTDEHKTMEYAKNHLLKDPITIMSMEGVEIFTVDEENNMEKIK